MQFKTKLFGSYLSQGYVSVVGILILPYFSKILGTEAYGVVSFYLMLQMWFSLLDLGVTPTISREYARFKAGSLSAGEFLARLSLLKKFFIGIGVIAAGAMFVFSEQIAGKWLKASAISTDRIVSLLHLITLAIVIRWMGGVYKGIVLGAERVHWLSIYNSAIASLRFLVVAPVLWVFGQTIEVFFYWQVLVSIIELISVFFEMRRCIPHDDGQRVAIDKAKILKFSVSLAFTSSVWVLVTQIDKLLLSGILPLSEYGDFSLSVMAASGVLMIIAPLGTVLMPLMARLHAEGKADEMKGVYRETTQVAIIFAGAITITLALFSKDFLFAWTGNILLAEKCGRVLGYYAIGNGVMVASSFVYFLQFAYGNLKYHLVGNLIMLLILVPAIVFGAIYFGGEGAGVSWMSVNLMYFFFWVTFSHKEICPGLLRPWMFNDIIILVFPTLLIASGVRVVFPSQNGRFASLLMVLVVSIVCVLVASLCSSYVRLHVGRILKKG
ncbi:MAG: lipopolysaccharide biosynthesis protein [Bdellovibrio sp.]